MNLSTLTTRYGVDAALRTLAEARTLLGSSADLTDANTALLTLQKQLKTGDYIVVDPDQSGYKYVTCYIEDDTRRERLHGHTLISSVVELAQRLNLPVVVGSEWMAQWRENVANKLRRAGVVAITDMED